MAMSTRFRSYPEMKDSGVESICEVREHWIVLPAQRLFEDSSKNEASNLDTSINKLSRLNRLSESVQVGTITTLTSWNS